MGAQTDAARAEVLASRAALLEEIQRLEGSARAAVDIPAKIRRAPAKSAGIAAGTAFIVLGGPQRLLRRARRAVRGPQAEYPKSLLPDDIEKTVRRLGSDGDKVRGTLEREFVRYLDDRSRARRNADASDIATTVLGNVLKPLSSRFGKQMAERLFSPDSTAFDEAMEKVRSRYAAQTGGEAAQAPVGAAAAAATVAKAGADARTAAEGAAAGAAKKKPAPDPGPRPKT